MPTACYVGLASRRLLLLPVLAAQASMFVIMARCFLALMPLAVSENPERTATGQIGPILEGSCIRARWHGASRFRTPGQDRHPRFLPVRPTGTVFIPLLLRRWLRR